MSLQTWVDDVSFDIHNRDADFAAREAIGALRTLEKPSKLYCKKGLGVDSTAGRKRRVTQVKKRFLKGRGRVGIMHRLRISTGVRYRLHKGAVHPVMSWGAQELRVLAGRGLKLQRSGSVDVVYDMYSGQPDPGDSIILQHLRTIWKAFWSWNTALQAARYLWQVSGPLQALQAYLLGLDFGVSNGRQWKRTGYGGIPDCIISLQDPWPILHHKLQNEFRWQRLLRLTRYEGCNDMERQLDWMISPRDPPVRSWRRG